MHTAHRRFIRKRLYALLCDPFSYEDSSKSIRRGVQSKIINLIIDVLSRFTKLAEFYGCGNTISYNVLFNFMTEYSRKLEYENCKSVVLEHDVECSACGCSTRILYSNVIPRVRNNAFGNTKHIPIKHCKLWLSHLQGREHVAISHEDLISLLTLAESDYSTCNGEFTCKVIRSY